MPLSLAEKDLMRTVLQAGNPALLGLVAVLDVGPLPVQQREEITRAMEAERRINRETWGAQSAEIERLMEYVRTTRPLAPDDAQLLRDAIETEAPSLLPLLDKIGIFTLMQDESNALRGGIGHRLISTGFEPPWELGGLTALYLAATYVGFAVPYLLALLTGAIGYTMLLVALAILAILTSGVVVRASARDPAASRAGRR